MKRFLFLALLSAWLAYPGRADAWGARIVSPSGTLIINNNNLVARVARVQVEAQPTRAFRPFLRRLAPRAAVNRDAQFGAPVDRFGRVRGAGIR